jgi:Tol biopolymer transport system component
VSNGGSWSPDGKEFVYNRVSDLFLAKSDGTESRKLASAPGQIYFMNWSPDGTTIRFNAFDPKVGTSILYEVLADGTNLHRLLPGWTKSPGGECCGIWTADGKYFIFDAAGKGVLHDTLWAIREKTGLFRRQNLEPERLTSDPVNYIAPLPSPDGKKLYAIGWLSRGELMRYDAKAGQFVSLLPGVSASDADFSRDGQWVVYVSYLDRTLWRSRVDGSESLQLTFPPTRALLPRWSPDGKRIAFMGRSPGKPWKIHLVSTEGGAPRQLISDERREFDPQWSPDGSQLLFGRGPVNSSSPPTLCLLDLRTGQVSEVPGSEGLGWPRWSYDGRYVAAIQDGDKRLVLFDFTTHRQVELAATKGSFSLPNWSHDGKWIYLWADFAEDRKGIYRVQLTDGKVELVASDKEVGRISGTSGPWVGLAPDDSPLVMRDISLTEIYAFDWAAP